MTDEFAVIDTLLDQIATPFPIRVKPEGVRVLAPTGEMGFIPEESVKAAVEAGAKVMSPEDMRALRQEVFMQHGIFKDQHQRPKQRKRRSIVKGGRR